MHGRHPLVGPDPGSADESSNLQRAARDANAARVAVDRAWNEPAFDCVENFTLVSRQRAHVGTRRDDAIRSADAEQPIEGVGGVANDGGAVAQKAVAAGGVRCRDAPWNGRDPAAELSREAGCD